jgi:hypothetical protein
LFADQQLPAVLLIWVACWLVLGIFLHRFTLPLPWADEWELSPVVAGREPFNWHWLWKPANEHRAPLTRLEVLVLGRLARWDMRPAHYVNLGLLALGSLVLMLAARAVRGRADLADTLLCLLVLSPWQFETVLQYVYSYAMALALMCLAVSAVMTGWPSRSLGRLGLYFVLLLAITLSGGPPGNLWALGLGGAVVARGWLDRKPGRWKCGALVGLAVVGAVSGVMLVSIPHYAIYDHLRGGSVPAVARAMIKLSVSWVGTPLRYLGYWALLPLGISGLYILGHILADLRRSWRARSFAGANLGAWLDLAIVHVTTVAVAAMIGYGRGSCGPIWLISHYSTLMIPFLAVTYLLLVRLRAPGVIPGTLALWMAVCVGWNWPDVMDLVNQWHAPVKVMWRWLHKGDEPLMAVAERSCCELHLWDPNRQRELLVYLLMLRDARLSVFRGDHQRLPVPGMGHPLLWEAQSGSYTAGLKLVLDDRATQGVALAAGDSGTATYNIEVPADGIYQLYCRVFVPDHQHFLTVAVDKEPAQNRSLPKRPEFYTYCGEPILLNLSAGRHLVSIHLGHAGTKLDLLELIPRSLPAQEARGPEPFPGEGLETSN